MKRLTFEVRNEKLEVIGTFQGGIMTTYDPRTDTFFNCTTVIGGPGQPSIFGTMTVDDAIEMLRDARRRHGLSKEE